MTNLHGKDLRAGRRSITGQAYIVTFVTRGRTPMFENLLLGRIVVCRMVKARGADTLAYVIMPDHVHWMLQLREDGNLSKVVHYVKQSSARGINRHLARRGPVWQRGFHDRAIRSEKNLRDAARYIVANPLRARLVQSVGEYPLWDACWL